MKNTNANRFLPVISLLLLVCELLLPFKLFAYYAADRSACNAEGVGWGGRCRLRGKRRTVGLLAHVRYSAEHLPSKLQKKIKQSNERSQRVSSYHARSNGLWYTCTISSRFGFQIFENTVKGKGQSLSGQGRAHGGGNGAELSSSAMNLRTYCTPNCGFYLRVF